MAVRAERYGDFGRVMERIGNHYIKWQKNTTRKPCKML